MSVDTFTVAVADRSWTPPSVVLDNDAVNSDRPTDPTLADTTGFSGGRFHTVPSDPFWSDTLFYAAGHLTDSVSGGPNDGYHYVGSSSYAMP